MAVNQVKAGAVLNYVIIGLNTLTGLLYTPFMLRCLGQNEYGIYSIVASIIAYLTILDFGNENRNIKLNILINPNRSLEKFAIFLLNNSMYSSNKKVIVANEIKYQRHLLAF